MADGFSEAERRFAASFPSVRLAEAKVQAFLPPIEHVDGFHGGPVLDEAHRIFRHHRDRGPRDHFDPGQSFAHRLSGDYTYAGLYYEHFGHFMSEMMHRIVPARMMGLPERYLFVTTQTDAPDRGFDDLPGYMRDVLALCGVGRNGVLVINRNTIVERLHLVPQAAAIAAFPKPGYLDALAAFTNRCLDRLHGEAARPAHLYVSRSAFSKVGSFLGESYIEDRLAEAGFTIFRPERHGVTEQMDYYRKARTVVFSGGSACHCAELFGRATMNAVAYIPRLSFQDRIFHRVLAPRSKTCAAAHVSTYLGSLVSSQLHGASSPIRGVSIFDLAKTQAWIEGMGFRLPTPLSPLRYALASGHDLAGYGVEARRTTERNATTRASLFLRMYVQILRPPRRDQKAASTGRRPLLTDREIAAILSAVEAMPDPFGPFWRLMLLTLQHHSLIATLLWPDLAPDAVSWTIPAERLRGSAHSMPLPRAARDLLAALPRHPGSDRVFHRGGKPLGRIAQAREDLDARIARAWRETAGAAAEPFPPWSLSDLRLAALQRLEEQGYDHAAIRATFGFARPEDVAFMQGIRGPSADPARILEAWACELAAMGSR